MSATMQQRPINEWVKTQIQAREARLELLLQKPATRLFYRASKAAYPLFPLLCEVEISFAHHGFQRVSMALGPLFGARVLSALEEQERIDDLLKFEHDFITRSGDCLAEQVS
jgi:hypothetical protein